MRGQAFKLDACNLAVEVYHVPTIYKVEQTQDSSTTFALESQMIGYYLNNWTPSWLCFFFFYQDSISSPIKINYTSLPATMVTSNKVLECSFSSLLGYYSQIKKIEAKGISDLNQYFYDKSVEWANLIIDGVFIQAHLMEISDPYQATHFQKIYHPGSLITVQGFFLGYAKEDVQLKLENFDDGSILFYSSTCSVLSQIKLECLLPLTFTAYGEFIVTLVATATQFQVSDSNILNLIVLPVPNVVSVSPTKTFVASLSELGEALQYQINLKVAFDSVQDTELINNFKQLVLERSICEL